MKKVIAIIVLGLLLSGNAYAENIYLICNRTIYENNGSGDWSLFYKEGQSDQPILISINEKNFKKISTKPTLIQANDSRLLLVYHEA